MSAKWDDRDWIPEWANEGRRPAYPPLSRVPSARDTSRDAQRGTRDRLLVTCRNIVTIVVSSTIPALMLFLLGASLDWW